MKPPSFFLKSADSRTGGRATSQGAETVPPAEGVGADPLPLFGGILHSGMPPLGRPGCEDCHGGKMFVPPFTAPSVGFQDVPSLRTCRRLRASADHSPLGSRERYSV